MARSGWRHWEQAMHQEKNKKRWMLALLVSLASANRLTNQTNQQNWLIKLTKQTDQLLWPAVDEQKRPTPSGLAKTSKSTTIQHKANRMDNQVFFANFRSGGWFFVFILKNNKQKLICLDPKLKICLEEPLQALKLERRILLRHWQVK